SSTRSIAHCPCTEPGAASKGSILAVQPASLSQFPAICELRGALRSTSSSFIFCRAISVARSYCVSREALRVAVAMPFSAPATSTPMMSVATITSSSVNPAVLLMRESCYWIDDYLALSSVPGHQVNGNARQCSAGINQIAPLLVLVLGVNQRRL